MKVYLSGAMSGLADFVAKFAAEAAVIRGIGHEVVCPAEMDNSPEWQGCLARDIPLVLSCEAVVVMPGWKDSGGSLMEAVVVAAVIAGKPVLVREGNSLVPCPEIPIPSSEHAREVAQVGGAAMLAVLQVMSGAWKSGKHGPGIWRGESLYSHVLKTSRHALTDFIKRTAPQEEHITLLLARECLSSYMIDKKDKSLVKDADAFSTDWYHDGEDHGAQAVCRSAMGWANKINGRS